MIRAPEPRHLRVLDLRLCETRGWPAATPAADPRGITCATCLWRQAALVLRSAVMARHRAARMLRRHAPDLETPPDDQELRGQQHA